MGAVEVIAAAGELGLVAAVLIPTVLIIRGVVGIIAVVQRMRKR